MTNNPKMQDAAPEQHSCASAPISGALEILMSQCQILRILCSKFKSIHDKLKAHFKMTKARK